MLVRSEAGGEGENTAFPRNDRKEKKRKKKSKQIRQVVTMTNLPLYPYLMVLVLARTVDLFLAR